MAEVQYMAGHEKNVCVQRAIGNNTEQSDVVVMLYVKRFKGSPRKCYLF